MVFVPNLHCVDTICSVLRGPNPQALFSFAWDFDYTKDTGIVNHILCYTTLAKHYMLCSYVNPKTLQFTNHFRSVTKRMESAPKEEQYQMQTIDGFN